ncbi:hypothetical protein FA15DRAFT_666700 [Coprinopsis marcescibilis]|uniref:Zn(2)-C6 fungal-type domain-containing protein n=1 Tax=Coprinopsis marcescibilis TaxID=230819 RepID=A0A5C3L4Y9_COPMA|nr:hypothetical protein FA15DRAFT_666700 [Coprinopsis marcescibilis]
MANPFTSNQHWDQSQMYYSQQNMQLDPELNYGQYPEPDQQNRQPRHQMPQPQQQLPQYPNHYQQYTQTPPGSNPTSTLQGALHTNQALSTHSRSSSYNSNSLPTPASASSFSSTIYGSSNGQLANQGAYHSNAFTFGTANVPLPLTGIDNSVQNSGMLTTSPDAMQDVFQPILGSQDLQNRFLPPNKAPSNLPGPSSAKRQRAEIQPEEFYYEDQEQEQENEQNDSKDSSKAKPTRACARCKNLKVKCEVKNEGDPCKRCLNGGHECVIPGRKVRRVPPKREHLISQIQTQAKEIERLMSQLEAANAVKKEDVSQEQQRQWTPSSVSSPVLDPSGSRPLLDSDAPEDPSNAAANKAIEDWIAKTRENMQELTFICLAEGGVPESYIVEEDPDDPYSSSDDEYVEASEDFEGFGNGNERYEVAVEDPDGAPSTDPERQSRKIRHRSSASSMGTTKSTTGSRKKITSDHGKPANLPVPAAPFGLMAKMSLKPRARSRVPSECDEQEDNSSGIANENFFKPSPAPEPFLRQSRGIQHQAPAILAKGLITPEDAEKLFQIYYTEMNLSLSLLDPVLYDAKRTFWRSPFLFTVICAIASRFYSERPTLYPEAMQYAQIAAGNALISGTKNVEMCAAYILMSLYPIPVKRWEHQRSWLYLGLAIRTATDLNLHLPITAKPKNENHAREMLNRTRIWLNCFNVDRSTGSQYGKPPIIGNHDYTANHSENWWRSSPLNLQHFDIHICAYNAELRLMSSFMAKIYSDPHHPTGLNKDVDFEAIATETDDELQQLQEKWFSILRTTDLTEPQNRFRTGLLRLAYSYARLIALSYGFQHAFGKTDGQDENPFLTRCRNAASDVVRVVVDDLCCPEQRHYFRHGPDAQSVFVTFASAFLVKLLQPKFASYLTREQRVEIRSLVQQVIDLLGSPEIAIDDRHGPKLYSRFLKGLLDKPLARIDPSSSSGSPTDTKPNRSRSKPPKPSTGLEQTESQPPSADPFNLVFNHPSPTTSASLSPPPAESMTDFNTFRPVGGIDPYAPDAPIMNAYDAATNGSGDLLMSDYFQPELPFDEEIIRSFQDLADPTGWQDISMPVGFNFMSQFQPQFQQNMGLDLRAATTAMLAADSNPPYLTA